MSHDLSCERLQDEGSYRAPIFSRTYALPARETCSGQLSRSNSGHRYCCVPRTEPLRHRKSKSIICGLRIAPVPLFTLRWQESITDAIRADTRTTKRYLTPGATTGRTASQQHLGWARVGFASLLTRTYPNTSARIGGNFSDPHIDCHG